MNEIIWIVQKDVFNNEARFVEALANTKTRYELFDKQDLTLHTIWKNDCSTGNDEITSNAINAFFYGSTHLIPQIDKKTKWLYFCTLNNYTCHKYYPVFRKYILNKDYYLLPLNELAEIKSARAFGYKVFIKPDRGFKSFNGMVVNLEDEWQEDINITSDLVLVSSPKEIKEEYRFVVCGTEIIDGCMYKPDQCKIKNSSITDYAKNIAALDVYNPDPMFTMDIALTDGGPKLLEINSFSCAELYACDLEKVITKANKVANDIVEDMICSRT